MYYLNRFLLVLLIVALEAANPALGFLRPSTTIRSPVISFKNPSDVLTKGSIERATSSQEWWKFVYSNNNKRVSSQVATIHKSSNENQDSGGSSSSNDANDDLYFDGRTTVALVGGQSLLIVASIVVAALIGTPNFGLGPGFQLNWSSISTGVLLTLPLGLFAGACELVEDKFPALQDVTKATQRSVLALLGGEFKPAIAIVTSLALGCVAGLGEEMLFRGVLQYELTTRLGQAAAVGASSVVFGALHAVTPLYAILAALASVYFGAIYIWSSNLAVPIITHAFYDLVALLFAHWTVCRLSEQEQRSLSQWKGPGDV